MTDNKTADRTFLGTGWGFPPTFSKDGKKAGLVSQDRDIRQSLEILMLTSPGERVMHPEFGCGLKSMVFEVIDTSAVTAIKDIIDRAVLFFEPRITLERVDVDTDRQYDGRLDIRLEYTVKTTNSRHNMVFPFYFLEGPDA